MPTIGPLRRHIQVFMMLCCAVVAASYASPAYASSTPVARAQAENGILAWNARVIADPTASGRSAVKYGYNGSVKLEVKLPADANTLNLRVRGDQCSGPPAYSVIIDGVQAATGTVHSASWATATMSHFLGAGTHNVEVQFTNYTFVVSPSCSRTLYLDDISFVATANLVRPKSRAIPAGFVHQSGTHLRDGAGNPIKLRGVDLGGWLSWEGFMWGEGMDYIGKSAMMKNLTSLVGRAQAQQFESQVYANYVTGSDFHAMSEYGLNVARLPINYRLLEDDSHPFVYKPSGWAVLDRAVNEAKADNVYLVLELEAVPCSQTAGFTADYVGGPLVWSSQQCEDRTVALWKAIAARYAKQNAVAGYDLVNEPVTSDQQLLALYRRITAAIRHVDRHHLLIYEGNDLARSFGLFKTPLDRNEMLEFHDYWFMLPGSDLATRMPGYDAGARKIHAPQWAGEFGQDVYSGIAHYVGTFNHDPLVSGWADWTWKQSPGFPALQTLQLSPAAHMLIDWINNTSRPKPTLAQARHGMTDFIRDIRFANTVPNAHMQQALGAGASHSHPGASRRSRKNSHAKHRPSRKRASRHSRA